MYVILIRDNEYISLYTRGEYAEIFNSANEAIEVTEELNRKEKDLFGSSDVTYQIVEVK